MENKQKTELYSHYNQTTEEYQTNQEHSVGTSLIAENKCTNERLKNILFLACIFHDTGKNSEQWQQYFQNSISGKYSSSGVKEDHTTAGGLMIRELLGDSAESFDPGLAQMLELMIYSHHGLKDSVSIDERKTIFQKRQERGRVLPLSECRENFWKEWKAEVIRKHVDAAKDDWRFLREEIERKINNWENSNLYGNRDFFLGLMTRYLISLLMDADKRDTEDFMVGESLFQEPKEEDRARIWEVCAENIEKRISKFSKEGELNGLRREISDHCRLSGEGNEHLFKLSVPTGAGKTLSSLRFAVNHARFHGKKRIFYIAPYNSITTQNAQEIKDTLHMEGLVLEHHCNLIVEDEREQALYDRVTEDWAPMVVVTTAVQFLNALFSEKSSHVRRMQSLSDSVIIIDEVQAFPPKLLELFNLAINFLTEFMNTSVVLCTATQPVLEQFSENRLRPAYNMVEKKKEWDKIFKRTEIKDCTLRIPGGMNEEQLGEFALEKALEHGNVLCIVNTKKCAREVYAYLAARRLDHVRLYHLSTNMTPSHRNKTLQEVKECLETGEPMICISTQLIEAGVDISFRAVIRSLAGLDSVIQSAGRCNRHKKSPDGLGTVYIVKMSQKAENLSHMPEIKMAQEAMEQLLYQFRNNPEAFEESLDSRKAIDCYYGYYFSRMLRQNQKAMAYPVTVKGVPTTLVRMLSDNGDLVKPSEYDSLLFKQAFQTAGNEFEVIEDNGKIGLVVLEDPMVEEKLETLEDKQISLKEKKRTLRELQAYSVAISKTDFDKVCHGVTGRWNEQVLILEKRFYDEKLGFTTEPAPMDLLMC